MFIWDFLASLVLDQIIDWMYNSVVGFLGDFFALMGQMGAELFDLPWVEAVTLFFGNFAWALYITGIVVAGFECAVEAQNGRGDIKGFGLNILKGFFAVNLFNIVPIRLYQFCISLQASFTSDIASINVSNGIGTTAAEILQSITSSALSTNPIVMLFAVIMMGYAVIKVFFANLKRGGIMVIQIAVGSLFMFSVPRGYIDRLTAAIAGLVLKEPPEPEPPIFDNEYMYELTPEQKKYANLLGGVTTQHLEPVKEGVEENMSVARKYGLWVWLLVLVPVLAVIIARSFLGSIGSNIRLDMTPRSTGTGVRLFAKKGNDTIWEQKRF